MAFLSSQLVGRLLIIAITTAATTVVPVLLQDRPKLLWVWDKIGPRVVSFATDKVEDQWNLPQ